MRTRARSGFALVLALFTLVLFGAIATAMAFAGAVETRASATTLAAAQSLSAAEAAAWNTAVTFDWHSALDLRPGQFNRFQTPSGATLVEVAVIRLDSTCFFIQASTESGPNVAGNARLTRRVGITIELTVDSAGVVSPKRVPNRAWVELF